MTSLCASPIPLVLGLLCQVDVLVVVVGCRLREIPFLQVSVEQVGLRNRLVRCMLPPPTAGPPLGVPQGHRCREAEGARDRGGPGLVSLGPREPDLSQNGYGYGFSHSLSLPCPLHHDGSVCDE